MELAIQHCQKSCHIVLYSKSLQGFTFSTSCLPKVFQVIKLQTVAICYHLNCLNAEMLYQVFHLDCPVDQANNRSQLISKHYGIEFNKLFFFGDRGLVNEVWWESRDLCRCKFDGDSKEGNFCRGMYLSEKPG